MHHFNIEKNDEDPKLEVGDHVKILKYKNIFGKDCTPNWVKKFFKKLKTLCRGHMLSVILMAKKKLKRSTKKNCKRQIKKSLELKK